jgi:aryl-alcohol dehydrogenase-like predicted oxidoreductase
MSFDHVDLIYASEPPPGMTVQDLVAEVGGLIAAGKARAWGLLNWPTELIIAAAEAAEAQSVPAPCAAQLPYSLVQRSPVEDQAMRDALGRAGAAVVASFCLAGGVLTGKYLSAEDAGRASGQLAEPRYAAAAAVAGELAALAARLDAAPAALALAFPLANAEVASVLFGATSAAQVRANCAAASLLGRLGPDELAALSRIGARGSP